MAASLPAVTPPPEATAVHEAILELFAMRAVHELGLARYVAGEPALARQVLALNPAGRPRTFRTLIRDEPVAWCDGLACAAGYTGLIPALAAGPWPRVITPRDAAQLLPKVADPSATVGTYGAEYLARAMYPLYAHNRLSRGLARYLFVDEVQAEAATRRLAAQPTQAAQSAADTARERWWALLRRLPTPARPRTVGADLTPVASPEPLPLDPGELSLADRCVAGLMVAHRQGWLTYLHPGPAGHSYLVRVANVDGDEVDREIGQARVAAWLLGVADFHGYPELVAFRDGLG
jgi:hypothetical protein